MDNKISFRTTKSQKKKIEQIAKARDMEISLFIRSIIDSFLSDYKNLDYLQESLSQLKIQAEKLSLEIESNVSKQKEKQEDIIRKLNNRLKNVVQDKKYVLQSVLQLEKKIKEHLDFNKFLERIDTMDKSELYSFYTEVVEKFPKKKIFLKGTERPTELDVAPFTFEEFKKYFESKKQQEDIRQ